MPSSPLRLLVRKPFAHAVLAALLVLPAIPGQAQLPTLGDGSDMASGAERRLGDRIARELYRDPDYLDDPVLVEYVQSIWQPLRDSARARGELTPELQERFAWEILLNNERTVNAFALPGGYMGVNLGLIGVVNSRDELASVLAHEMSHVTQRHISRLMTQQSRQTPWLIGAMILGALAASKSPDAANALVLGGQAVAAQNQLNFSRDMEREADRVGYGVMTQAGYSGQGFVSMFEKLQSASRINDNGSFPYLRSHPLTTQRIADMQSRHQMEAATAAPLPLMMEPAMVGARARALSRPGIDLLRQWVAEPDSAAFKTMGPPQQAASLYAATRAALQQRDFERARSLALRLTDVARKDPAGGRQALLLSAEVELAAGNPQRALTLLAGAAPKRPELVLKSQAHLHLQLGQGAEAVDSLQTWLATHPRDALVWQLLATAYQQGKQPLRALRAEAESRVAQLDYSAAMDRYRAAQDVVRQSGAAGDNVEASIIDTRAREVQALLREQMLDAKNSP